jgi:hypothetical protein
MSLINEALKKAQKQRTGETPEMPAVGGESAARIARRGQPAGLNSLVLRISLGVVALAVVITGAVLIMRSPTSAVPQAATTSASATPTATAPTPGEPAPATTPDAAASLGAPAASPTTPVTVVFTPAETPKPVDPAPVQLAPAPPKPSTAKLDPRAINFINSIRVAGIRASANDSKVLMNDRVYRVGNIVEAEMGLKLAGITPNSLTFEDENGAQFTRVF